MKYCLSAFEELDARLRSGQRILIASDFDGTLCPIAESPGSVHVPRAMLQIARRLSMAPGITLAVISGRSLDDVSARLPVDIIFSGNHGLEIRGCGVSFEHPEVAEYRADIISAVAFLQESLSDWPEAWVEDKGLTCTVHYRQVARRLHNPMLFAARQCLRHFGRLLAFRLGNHAFEVRPRLCWSKGSALALIRERKGPFDLCLCLGDDRTDETMFRANPDGINVRVRVMQPTLATHYLNDPSEVALLLSHILDVRENTSAVSEEMAFGVALN